MAAAQISVSDGKVLIHPEGGPPAHIVLPDEKWFGCGIEVQTIDQVLMPRLVSR